MQGSERHLERNEEFERQRADQTVARIRSSLTGVGSKYCQGCGDLVGEARRRALPSAKLCVDCQGKSERRARLMR